MADPLIVTAQDSVLKTTINDNLAKALLDGVNDGTLVVDGIFAPAGLSTVPKTSLDMFKDVFFSYLLCPLPAYTVAEAVLVTPTAGRMIYVSNGAAGQPVVAFGTGAAWLRVDTRAAISAT